MKIKFKKEYDDDTRWPDIILDFLEYVGQKYYKDAGLDEYDLYSIIWAARHRKVGKMLSKSQGPAHNMFDHIVKMEMQAKEWAAYLRDEYRDMLTELMPKKESSYLHPPEEKKKEKQMVVSWGKKMINNINELDEKLEELESSLPTLPYQWEISPYGALVHMGANVHCYQRDEAEILVKALYEFYFPEEKEDIVITDDFLDKYTVKISDLSPEEVNSIDLEDDL